MTIAQSSTEQHIATQSSTQQLTAAHRQLTAAHRQLAAAQSIQTGSSQQLIIALCISHVNIYMCKYVYHTSSRSFALLLFPVPTTYTPSRL